MPFNLQTYRLAEVARKKLWNEAARSDHNLHHLVLHANLLDDLVEEISLMKLGLDTEDQQKMRNSSLHRLGGHGHGHSNQKVKKNMTPEVEMQHIALQGPTNGVVFMTGINQHVPDEEPSSLPYLSHDSDSDSDSNSEPSDTEPEDSSQEEWLATSVSEEEIIPLGTEEDLILHRTTSHTWKPSLHPN